MGSGLGRGGTTGKHRRPKSKVAQPEGFAAANLRFPNIERELVADDERPVVRVREVALEADAHGLAKADVEHGTFMAAPAPRVARQSPLGFHPHLAVRLGTEEPMHRRRPLRSANGFRAGFDTIAPGPTRSQSQFRCSITWRECRPGPGRTRCPPANQRPFRVFGVFRGHPSSVVRGRPVPLTASARINTVGPCVFGPPKPS